jgi:periplasmic divalent cation tolerance protein
MPKLLKGGNKLFFKYIIVTSTFESKEEAIRILKLLLNKHLVSCGQINEIQAIYWWKNGIANEQEFLLTCKTRRKLFQTISKIIKQNHSYEVCQIIAHPICFGDKAFFRWIEDCTSSAKQN